MRIKAAPKIRQVYWCDFQQPPWLPEFGKTRPVIVVSYKHVLHGHSLVVPTSTDPQEGWSAQWAHKLSFSPTNDGRDSWVVCNHLYTVTNERLAPFKVMQLVDQEEFNLILAKILNWLPVVR